MMSEAELVRVLKEKTHVAFVGRNKRKTWLCIFDITRISKGNYCVLTHYPAFPTLVYIAFIYL